ncbi:MAG: RNA polymerase sporulation sigma factor SigE [Ruminococcaceae bacterium]|nr:RNA polymerase sporulation sigma factor SigE [Oscillospiraceae bacterium]
MKNLLLKIQLFFKKLFKLNSVYYVNGHDTLPPPLSASEEQHYTILLQQNNQQAKNILIERNLRLVVYIAKRFENTGISIEDLVSIGTIGLIKGVNTFKFDKNIKLATYASRCIENEILMYLRKNTAQKCEISIEEPLNVDWDGNELLLSDILGTDSDIVHKDIEKEVESKLLKDALDKLLPREREIMNLRFGFTDGKEYTQKEVAQMLNISQSYISRLEKKILNKLKREILTSE